MFINIYIYIYFRKALIIIIIVYKYTNKIIIIIIIKQYKQIIYLEDYINYIVKLYKEKNFICIK